MRQSFYLSWVGALLLGLTQCAPARLENTSWNLVELEGKALDMPMNAKRVYIQLKGSDEQQNLSGFAGCNSMGGSYSTPGDNAIIFEPISTRMFCEETMELENAFIKMLTSADRYQIEGRQLLLYKQDLLLGKFRAG